MKLFMRSKNNLFDGFNFKKIFLSLLFFTVMAGTNCAQENRVNASTSFAVEESIYVQTNTSTVLSGESLLFKLYVLQGKDVTLSKISKIAYLSIYDATGKNVLTQKIEVKDGLGNGDFFIPATLPTGIYGLKAYTNWMLNAKSRIAINKKIIVINPFEVPKSEIKASLQSNTDRKEMQSEIAFSQLDKKIYTTREQVQLRLNLVSELKNASYSISIRKTDELPKIANTSIVNTIQNIQNQPTNLVLNPSYIPEIFGETLSGYLTSKDSQISVKDKVVILSVTGDSFTNKLATTDANGKFSFVLDKQLPKSQLFVQVFDQEKENFKITFNDTSFLENDPLDTTEFPFWNESLKTTIQDRSIAMQIENAYYFKKQDSIAPAYQYKSLIENMGKAYNLEDFTRFPKIRETLIEIISEVYVVQNKNNYSLRVKNYDPTNQNTFPTMVLVDGLFVQNIKDLIDSKSENFKKIQFVPGYYYLGKKIFDGIVSFETKTNNYQPASDSFTEKVTIARPRILKKQYQPNYSESTKVSLDKIPDYRYQLLWLPEVDKNISELTFFTSDVVGQFEIVIEGINNQGTAIYSNQTFEVK